MNRKIIALTAGLILTTAGLASLGSSSANAAPVQTEFMVTSLTLDNLIKTDAIGCLDDDGGLVSIAGSRLLVGGDGQTCSYSLTDMSGGTQAGSLTDEGSFIFTDLSTSSTYFFDYTARNNFEPVLITKFTRVNNDFSLGNDVVLSENITYTQDTIIGHGWGRVVLWDTGTGQLHDINISDGTVSTTNGAATEGSNGTYCGGEINCSTAGVVRPEDSSEADSGFQSAIAEYSNGAFSFIFPNESGDNVTYGVYRFYPLDGPRSDLILDLTGLNMNDFYSLTYSAATGQWCGHIEDSFSPQLGEGVFCAGANVSVTEAVAPPVPIIANGYRADSLGSVYFTPGSSKLSNVAKSKIWTLVTANPASIYKVTGYVQEARSSKNDSELSLSRARAVETYLASIGAGVNFTVVVDAGLVPVKNGTSDKARRATLFAMTPVVK